MTSGAVLGFEGGRNQFGFMAVWLLTNLCSWKRITVIPLAKHSRDWTKLALTCTNVSLRETKNRWFHMKESDAQRSQLA